VLKFDQSQAAARRDADELQGLDRNHGVRQGEFESHKRGGRGRVVRARIRRLVLKGKGDAPGDDCDDGLLPTTIAGIVIGSVVLLVGGVILAFILVKRRG
jgi:hypothetical protein